MVFLFYRLAKVDDIDNIVEFCKTHFHEDEPCNKALGIPFEESRGFYRDVATRCVQYPFSTVVTTGDGEIVGILLNSVWNRSDDMEDHGSNNEGVSEQILAISNLIGQCRNDFWKLAPPDISTVLHREISSVSNAFQRRGIANQMASENMNLENLRKYNIGGIMSETTSYANQVLLEKHGFETLKEYMYSDILNSKGERLLITTDGSTGTKLNFKRI